MLQLGYAIDDLQYGFRAIVNNIPQIAMSIGGASGMALGGAASIAAVAINQLVGDWRKLGDALQATYLNTTTEQMTKLREATEGAAEAFDKLAKTPTKAKAATAAIVSEAITEAPPDVLLKQVTEAITKDKLLGTTPHLGGKERTPAQRLALKLMGYVPIDEDPRRLGAAAQQAEKEARAQDAEKAKQLLGKASEGDPQAILTLEGLMRRQSGAFSKDVKADLYFTDPSETERGQKRRAEARKSQEEADKLNADKTAKTRKEIEIVSERQQRERIQKLEDERETIQKAQHAYESEVWERLHEQMPGQILHGARAATDYYQTGGRADAKEIAKEAHAQREKTIAKLNDIADALKKEQRLVVRH